MTPAQFKLCFPEFAETDVTVVAAKLMLAAAKMGGPDYTVWGQPSPQAQPGNSASAQPLSLVDSAQGYYAAHLLQTSPTGTSTLLVQPSGTGTRTVYLDQFEELMLAVAGGFACAGAVV